MPGSDGLAFVAKGSWMARAARQKDYDHLQEADRLTERMAAVLSALKAGEPTESFRRPVPLDGRGNPADRLAAWLYHAFMGFLKTRFRADERCEGCGLCEQLCPVGNVGLHDGHPQFAGHCMLCMRCIHACPREAIQIGRLTVDKFRWRGPKGEFRPLRLRPAPAGRDKPVANDWEQKGPQDDGA
jgi:ferredoxin